MTITVTLDFAGQVGVNPRLGRVLALASNFAQVTAAGFLNPAQKAGEGAILPTDFFAVTYQGGFGWFSPSISAGVITLVPIGPAVAVPTIANHIAVYKNTDGALGEDAATAINGGNIQAGLSGTAGALESFPATAATGSFVVQAASNAGNTVTTLTNASMGQATVITIPDPASATANDVISAAALVNNNLVKASGTAGLVADAGARIISNTTAAFGGGSTTNTFTATGLTATCHGTAVIRASTNSVSITKALPGTNTLAITFSADPGAATTVDYIYTTASQS